MAKFFENVKKLKISEKAPYDKIWKFTLRNIATEFNNRILKISSQNPGQIAVLCFSSLNQICNNAGKYMSFGSIGLVRQK